jgi:hypothetical protein
MPLRQFSRSKIRHGVSPRYASTGMAESAELSIGGDARSATLALRLSKQ